QTGVQDKKLRMPENRTLSFRAEMPGIGRIPGISDPESIFVLYSDHAVRISDNMIKTDAVL
ncbi:hypothetical protein QUF72_08870, partial [Desulfobacterales bacterium HSG2]|nr:hypothetical protein [Desulfobacterales bacterium HSG2]